MNTNNPSLISEIETKIQETQTIINTYKQQLASQENILQAFIKQLTQIKLIINENKQIK